MDALHGPIMLKLISGVMRPVQTAWAERRPAVWGFIIAWAIVLMALYGHLSTLYGLIFNVIWHLYWMQAFKKDPMYCRVLWEHWFTYRWPEYLSAWPEIGAEVVKLKPSVPSIKQI